MKGNTFFNMDMALKTKILIFLELLIYYGL